MGKRPFPLIETKPLPRGSAEYEKKRAQVVQKLHDSIPEDLWLSQDIIAKPPLDVTEIPKTCGILTKDELEITETYDATGLAEAIASKKLTAAAVARAFAKRAAIAHQLTCCLTSFFMDEALERAAYLDDHLETNGKTVGPLHGVPFSVKEHVPLAGHNSSWGFLSTVQHSEDDALSISILRSAGAVFYCKTNQPQGIMHLESDSFHGRTLNPHNINLSAGGSTGGEAALIALKGSVLGIGSDIGGSIRGPGAFSGIHGFKPTSSLLTIQETNPYGFAGELNIDVCTGPLACSLRDIDLFMHVLTSSNQHLIDPRVIPIPWTGLSTPLPTPIKLGIMSSDGAITPQPPVLRALEWAESLLSSSTLFTLKPYTPYNSAEAISHIRRMYYPDGALPVKAALSAAAEPMFPLTADIISSAESDAELTASDIIAERLTRDAFRAAFAQHWNKQDVDFVLCPVHVGPASAHDQALYWNYTALWNFVDYPGAVFPTPIRVENGEKGKGYDVGWKPLSREDQEVKEMWERNDYVGAPICLQLVGRRYADNGVVGVLGALQRVLGFR